ncbi:unnamed protein product [Anisakis simplex]|uniref:Protein lethal(2)essential for life (inferred by orthology to a D. melanogaster protein) n=1 Tax=Anisakis simplex TaxID=6269 RepID=A0A0M3JX08_ANISI|nr:unnamed protein product [Anisakis simplex]
MSSSWWIDPVRRERYAIVPPTFERAFSNMFEDMMRDMSRPYRSVAPYWLEQPQLHECNIGNTVGRVVDDKDKFAVEMDVSQFHPEELSVNVRENELVVEGHHEERNDAHGSIERHFVRKYIIPKDTHLDAIVSHISDKGILSVTAPKQNQQLPAARSIPIQAAPRQPAHKSADAPKPDESKKE